MAEPPFLAFFILDDVQMCVVPRFWNFGRMIQKKQLTFSPFCGRIS